MRNIPFFLVVLTLAARAVPSLALVVAACSTTVPASRLTAPASLEALMQHDPATAMYRANAQRTGEYPCHLPTPPEYRWQHTFYSGSMLSPIVSERYVGYGSGDGSYQLMDPLSGDVLFRWKAPRRSARSEMAFDGERVFVGLGYDLVAMGLEPAEELWRSTEGRSHAATPLLYREALYVNAIEPPPAKEALLRKFDLEGKLLWEVRFPSRRPETQSVFVRGPAAMGELVVVSVQQRLYALDLESGAESWNLELSQRYNLKMPVVAEELGIVFTRGDSLYAVQAETGTLLWSSSFEGRAAGELTYSDGLVYLASQEGLVSAYDAQTGVVLWQQQRGEWAQTPIIAGDLLLYVELCSQLVHALDKHSGEWRWTVSLREDARELACYGDMLIAGGHTLHGLQSL
ncbi:MAG: PQQ-binding-like beta-propeller repeat protein [Myxococcota bacterium]|nr:PQQ-binding-like beta-propeller repeat protein [Myxococcota bacterium]